MSSRTMSGRSRRAASTAEAASSASPTTSKPSASSSSRALARKPAVVVDDQDGSSHVQGIVARVAARGNTASRTRSAPLCAGRHTGRAVNRTRRTPGSPNWKRRRPNASLFACREPDLSDRGNRHARARATSPRAPRRWSATHRKTAIWGWLAFVIALVVIGSAVGTKAAEQDEGGPGESGRADKTINDAFPKSSDESVLVQSGRYTAGDPQFRAAVRDAMAAVSAQPHVRAVESPYRSGRHLATTATRRSSTSRSRARSSDAEDRVGPVTSAVEKVDARHGDVRVEQFGEASAGKALSDRFEEDFQKAETPVAAADAADPDRRVRRAGGGGHPAAAGGDRGGGHDRPDRADLATSSRWTRRSRRSCC